MSVAAEVRPSSPAPEHRPNLAELQDESILFVLPVLYVAGLVQFAAAGRLDEPGRGVLPIVATVLVGGAVLALRRLHRLAAAWTVVLGSVAVILLAAARFAFPSAVVLLPLVVGLASLFVNVPAGALVAAACTALLMAAPAALVPASSELRAVTAIAVWGAVGLARGGGLSVSQLLACVRALTEITGTAGQSEGGKGKRGN